MKEEFILIAYSINKSNKFILKHLPVAKIAEIYNSIYNTNKFFIYIYY